MKIEKITKAEFENLTNSKDGEDFATYFCNGVIFDSETDNVIAFPVYNSAYKEPADYYEVKNDKTN